MARKVCHECKRNGDFYESNRRRCKRCVNRHAKDRYVRRKEADPAGFKQSRQVIAQKNKETHPEAFKQRTQRATRRYRARNPEKARESVRKSVQKVRLRKRGWTIEAFEAAWVAQNGRCLICARSMLKNGHKSESVTVDHDHVTGMARGLLCTRCNIAVGRFESLLRLLAGNFPFVGQIEDYLRKYSPDSLTVLPRAEGQPLQLDYQGTS